MILPEITERVKNTPDLPKDIFIVLLIILTAVGGFFLGRLSVLDRDRGGGIRVTGAIPVGSLETTTSEIPAQTIPLAAVQAANNGSSIPSLPTTPPQGLYVGSKNGKTYHLPWCTGAKRIKDANKIWFASKEEAEQKGYSPATNCKGI